MVSNQLIVICKELVWHRITQSGVITPPLSVKVMNILYQPQEMIQTVKDGAHIVAVCVCVLVCIVHVCFSRVLFNMWTLEPVLVCTSDRWTCLPFWGRSVPWQHHWSHRHATGVAVRAYMSLGLCEHGMGLMAKGEKDKRSDAKRQQ